MAALAPASTTRFEVDGMDCAGCARKIETAVRRMPGVTGVEVSVATGAVRVLHGDAAPAREAIANTINGLGYKVRDGHLADATAHPDHAHGHDHAHGYGDEEGMPWWKTKRVQLVGLTGVLLAAAFLVSLADPGIAAWAFIAATVVGLLPIARRAFAAARAGLVFTIEMLMTIAAIGALVIGASSEAAVVVFLFAVGEALESFAADRARRSIKALGDLTPKTAQLLENGNLKEVPAAALLPGQQVLVRPGDRVPADGRILEGMSSLDEAPVTGESVPKSKSAGDSVFAGTINQEGALTVEVERAAADNTIARIIRLVEEAQEAKAPTERFIDRFSRWYMPAVVGAAILVALIAPLAFDQLWEVWIYRALALLLIACPCALVISTPAAIAAGLAAGARRGLLMKGGVVLENLAKIKVVALDKTGTLTRGLPVVTDVAVTSAVDEREVLRLAASLEQGSSHPIAKAILDRAKAEGLTPAPVNGLRTIPGKGIQGTVQDRVFTLNRLADVLDQLEFDLRQKAEDLGRAGKTLSVLLVDDKPIGLIAMRDEPRADARAGLARLRSSGVDVVMLTGDNHQVAEAVAAEFGIEVRAGLLPEDKAGAVRELLARGPVAKVGDGINDAPALAAATVGIAMGSGTDVALETADAALLRNEVGGIAELMRLARATLNNVYQNVVFALGFKLIFLVTSVAGLTGLWIAILADTGATVLVTLNALRLLRLGSRPL